MAFNLSLMAYKEVVFDPSPCCLTIWMSLTPSLFSLLVGCVLQCVWLSEPDHCQTVWSRQQLSEACRRGVKRHQSPFQHGWKWSAPAGSGQLHLLSCWTSSSSLLLLVRLAQCCCSVVSPGCHGGQWGLLKSKPKALDKKMCLTLSRLVKVKTNIWGFLSF